MGFLGSLAKTLIAEFMNSVVGWIRGKKEEESSMEASEFPVDPPNCASCLPPRKRLLAGLRIQNGFLPSSSSSSLSSSSSSSSPSSSTSLSPSPSLSSLPLSIPFVSSASTEFGVHICDFLNGSRRIFLSPEEVIEASRSAAVAAAGIAAAAKATALEKAEIAAKAAAAAKNALELVASSTDKAFSKGVSRKSKTKKHVPVKLLYKNKFVNEACEAGRAKEISNSFGRTNKRKSDTLDIGDGENRFKVPRQGKTLAAQEHVDDEELALRLHRAMNSSPRILKKTMNVVLKTEVKPNDSDRSRKVISHKKHRGAKYALLEKVQASDKSQISKGNATSLSNGHGSNHVEGERCTYNMVDSLATKVKSSIRHPTEDRSNQCEGRSNIPHEEGEADHFVVDDKQHVDASETGNHGKLIFKHKKLLLNLSTVRNSKIQPLDLKSTQGRKSELLWQQEELEPKGFSLIEASAPHSFADRLKSEHDVRNKPVFMLTSSEQHEASNDASAVWNFRKFMFPQSQCVAENKNLCSLHANSTVTTGCSSIKVDE